MENKKFDIVDIILEKFDYHTCGKELRDAEKQLNDAIEELTSKLTYPQAKLLRNIQDLQNFAIIAHEKEVAYYVLDCLRAIFSEFK